MGESFCLPWEYSPHDIHSCHSLVVLGHRGLVVILVLVMEAALRAVNELGEGRVIMASIATRKKSVLRGWKRYVAVGAISYVFLVPLMWLSSLKRHPPSPFETVPEITALAAIPQACIVWECVWASV